MKYLLDTSVCITLLRGTSQVVTQRLAALAPEDIFLSSVVKAELLFGAERSNQTAQMKVQLAPFLSQSVSLPFDDLAAEDYARLRADLARTGTLIGPNDLLIAAIAVANNLTLVTHNTREFARVTGLRFEDWQANS